MKELRTTEWLVVALWKMWQLKRSGVDKNKKGNIQMPINEYVEICRAGATGESVAGAKQKLRQSFESLWASVTDMLSQDQLDRLERLHKEDLTVLGVYK